MSIDFKHTILATKDLPRPYGTRRSHPRITMGSVPSISVSPSRRNSWGLGGNSIHIRDLDDRPIELARQEYDEPFRSENPTGRDRAMKARFNFPTIAPDAYEAVATLDVYVRKASGIESRLLHLIKLRASQINGCAFCVDMHVKEARRDGLSEQRINLVGVWRDSPVFDPRERAVLGWTEALTNIAQSHAPDADFEPLQSFFTDAEITRISVAIGTINVWNRLCVGFRSQHPIDEG